MPSEPEREADLHGGAFFDAIGEEFDDLSRRRQVINADVLDAWFPPSPEVIRAIERDLPWVLQTSPPTESEGMVRVIARARGVPPESILPGGGSSSLIFLALREWLPTPCRVLLPDPAYGEYAHMLEKVIGCEVHRLPLSRPVAYRLEPGRLADALKKGYDWAILVNPNSPTGGFLARAALEEVLRAATARTRFWIDETYVEYAGDGESLEPFAAASANVVVCKSMSKVYALSGVRVAYLCAPPALTEALRRLTPPWAVSLMGQIAAVRALESIAYYRERWRETRALRGEMAAALEGLGAEVVPSSTNFLLFHLPEEAAPAREVVRRCRKQGLFLRDAGEISPILGDRALRTAVKDAETNARIVEILRAALH
jgi:histidinol-phosphate/aromatic aminotransferase/cobyric acid decarboxylase-like protein